MTQALKTHFDLSGSSQTDDNLIPLTKDDTTTEIEKRNLHSQIGHIKEKYEQLDKWTANYGAQTKRLTGKVSDIQDKFSKLADKLDHVEVTTGNLTQTSRLLAKKTQALTFKTDDLIKKTDQLDKRTTALKTAADDVTSRVEVLEPKSYDLETRTDQLRTQSDALELRTTHLHLQFKKALWVFGAVLAFLSIAGAATLFYTNRHVDQLQPAIIDSVTQSLAQDMAQLKLSDADLRKGISQIDQQIAQLEKSKEALAGQLTLMNGKVKGLDKRVVAQEKASADVKTVLKKSSLLFNDVHSKAWVLEQPAHYWTIQLMCATAEKGAIRFVNAYNYQEPLAYYKTIYKNQEWYVVMAGSYASREAAQAAATQLPKALKIGKPWIRSFADIQGRITTYHLEG